jgi:FixJ family two-component response regulator
MADPSSLPTVYIVDDDFDLGASLARLLIRSGFAAEPFLDPAQLLAAYDAAPAECIITDVMMGELDGFAFADQIRARDDAVSIIFITAWPTTSDAVDSVRKFSGIDYLEKPVDEKRLLRAVNEGAAWSRERRRRQNRIAALTPREREVFALLVRGLSNKAIASALNLSPKTIEDHRARISAKTCTSGLAQLIALASSDRSEAGRPFDLWLALGIGKLDWCRRSQLPATCPLAACLDRPVLRCARLCVRRSPSLRRDRRFNWCCAKGRRRETEAAQSATSAPWHDADARPTGPAASCWRCSPSRHCICSPR